MPPLRVFHNRDHSFSEVSRDWDLSVSSAVADFALNDYDADGRLDLFVLPWRRNVKLYRNSSPGSFVDTVCYLGRLWWRSIRATFQAMEPVAGLGDAFRA